MMYFQYRLFNFPSILQVNHKIWNSSGETSYFLYKNSHAMAAETLNSIRSIGARLSVGKPISMLSQGTEPGRRRSLVICVLAVDASLVV